MLQRYGKNPNRQNFSSLFCTSLHNYAREPSRIDEPCPMLPGVSPPRRKPRADGERKEPELSRGRVCARVALSPRSRPYPSAPAIFSSLYYYKMCVVLCVVLCAVVCVVGCVVNASQTPCLSAFRCVVGRVVVCVANSVVGCVVASDLKETNTVGVGVGTVHEPRKQLSGTLANVSAGNGSGTSRRVFGDVRRGFGGRSEGLPNMCSAVAGGGFIKTLCGRGFGGRVLFFFGPPGYVGVRTLVRTGALAHPRKPKKGRKA